MDAAGVIFSPLYPASFAVFASSGLLALNLSSPAFEYQRCSSGIKEPEAFHRFRGTISRLEHQLHVHGSLEGLAELGLSFSTPALELKNIIPWFAPWLTVVTTEGSSFRESKRSPQDLLGIIVISSLDAVDRVPTSGTGMKRISSRASRLPA